MIYHLFKKPKAILFIPLLLALLFVVACGTSTDPPSIPPTQAQAAPTTAAPQAAGATTGPTLIAAAPVATPTKSAAPAVQSADIKGTVTVMIGNWGNERLYSRYASGEVNSYSRLLHAYLVQGLGGGGVTPAVAESWRVNDNGTEWIFKIRQGIPFHNGEIGTTEDALFSMNRQVHLTEFPEPATSTQQTQRHNRGDRDVEITGPDEITVFYEEPFPSALSWFSAGHAGHPRTTLMPEALLGPPYEVSEPAWEKDPISAGPMVLVDHVRAQSMSFERFDDYYYQPSNGLPEDRRMKFKNLELKLVPELSTRVAALRAGAADLIEASLAVRKQIEGADGRIILAPESSYVYFLTPGCWKPESRCADIRVRHALDWAVDEQLIVDALYSPEVMQITGFSGVAPSSLGYTPELGPFGFDPDKARALLKEAGYKVPGSPEGKDFGKLSLSTWDASDIPLIPEMAQLIAEFWETELGIEVELFVGDSTAVRGKWRGRELDDNAILRTNEAVWDAGTRLPSGYLTPESSSRRSQPDAEPELAAILREALAVVDPTQRQEGMARAYLAANEAHFEWQPMVASLPWGASKRIAKWEPWPLAAFFNAAYTIELAE